MKKRSFPQDQAVLAHSWELNVDNVSSQSTWNLKSNVEIQACGTVENNRPRFAQSCELRLGTSRRNEPAALDVTNGLWRSMVPDACDAFATARILGPDNEAPMRSCNANSSCSMPAILPRSTHFANLWVAVTTLTASSPCACHWHTCNTSTALLAFVS